MSYLDSLPLEILELVVYRLDNDDLMSIFRFDEKIIDKLNWSRMHSYLYGSYKSIDCYEYYRLLSLKKLNDKLVLDCEISNSYEPHILDLSCRRLRKIPKEIGSIKSLECLYIENNWIIELPIELSFCKFLLRLILCRNYIRVVPKWIFDFKYLEVLDLSENNIKEIPKEIGNLNKLRVLHISMNQITVIPPDIGNLSDLEILSLGDNELEGLPIELLKLKKLQKLTVYNNPIKEIPREFLSVIKEKDYNVKLSKKYKIEYKDLKFKFLYNKNTSFL